MRFILLALLGLIILMRHQALALLATPTKIAKVERDITTPYNFTRFQIVHRDGASLGTSDDAVWTSTLVRMQLLVDLPITIANDMGIMATTISWKIKAYWDSATSGGGIFYGVSPDGTQTQSEIDICFDGPLDIVATGTSNGNNWVQLQMPLVVSWVDTFTNKLIAVFWTATYQFGENNPDLTYLLFLDIAPLGWEQSGPMPSNGCPDSGVGISATPTLWSYLPWSTIISNLGS
jgi:hypothetical protein